MERAVEPASEDIIDRRLVAQVGQHELGARRDRRPVAPLEVVEDRHLMAVVEQLLCDDRADVAGAAGHEQFHRGRLVRESLRIALDI